MVKKCVFWFFFNFIILCVVFQVCRGCDVWHKSNVGIKEWNGDLNVNTDTSYGGVELQLLFDQSDNLQVNNAININNSLLEIQLKADYDEYDIPVLYGVVINGVDIKCNKNVLLSPAIEYKPQIYQPPPLIPITTTSIAPPQNVYTIPEECGIVIPGVTPFIHYGNVATAGEFPWHAAIFDMPQYKYRCGGSLISSNLVVTAAHCVTKSFSIQPILESSIMIVLGKDQLQTTSIVEQNSTVAQIHVHFEFDQNTFNNDIAAIKLQTQIMYTNFVRPICLWPHINDRIYSIVHQYGSIPGFGYNENFELAPHLTSVKMPVVSYETCLSSHRDFYARVISETNFCAGFRNGSSVCNGDSGGGMVFKINSLFYLRGIVSIGPTDRNDRTRCNTLNYIVFTDVADFIDWLRQF